MWPFIGGLFGGAGATLLWEVFVRPVITGRSVAEVLAAEVSMNLELLAEFQALSQKRSGIPADLELSTIIFENLVDRIGDLRPDLVGEIVFLYKYFDQINETPKAWVDGVEELRGYQPDSENYWKAEHELRQMIAVFKQSVEKAITRINLVQPKLLESASPWWSLRGRRGPRPSALTVGDLEQRLQRAMRDRHLFLDDTRVE